MGVGSTIGGIAGGVGGFIVGGPVGAAAGYAGGSYLGGKVEDSIDEYGRPTGRTGMGRNLVQYGGLGANREADRASQMGAESAQRARVLGQQLGYDAEHGQRVSENYQNDAYNRSSGLYGAANASYGRAGAADAMQQGARGDAMSAIGRLRNFYEQGPGPSAAEAQLRQGADSNARNALSLARTGGGSAASMRAALRANAAGGQQTNQAAAGLRAQEAANWRQTQLSAMGAEQQALGNVRAGDMSAMGQHYGAGGQQLGAAGAAGQLGLGYGGQGLGYMTLNSQTRMGAEGMANAQQNAGEAARGTILGQQLGADASRYGADKGVAVGMANVQQRQDAANMAMAGSLIGTGVQAYTASQASDVRAKENIRPTSAADLIDRLDQSYARDAADTGPRANLRAAGSYSYDYKDPARHGAGSYVGPMAQELEQTDAAGAVGQAPDGTKTVDPGRLTMVNTSAISEQQKRLDRLEALLNEGGDQRLAYRRIRGERA